MRRHVLLFSKSHAMYGFRRGCNSKYIIASSERARGGSFIRSGSCSISKSPAPQFPVRMASLGRLPPAYGAAASRLRRCPACSAAAAALAEHQPAVTRLTIRRPDDWCAVRRAQCFLLPANSTRRHLHLRDGPALASVVPHTAKVFGRAVVMPTLKPPVRSVADARAYRERILAALPPGSSFEPLMTLYLTGANLSTRATQGACSRGCCRGRARRGAIARAHLFLSHLARSLRCRRSRRSVARPLRPRLNISKFRTEAK